jgi:alkylation response protein AidB-like acyl-CoA dehydrogenase
VDFAPSTEQAMLQDMVRRFLSDRQDLATIGREPIAGADWAALGELGLFSFLLPERAGGMGGGAADTAIVAEELGRGLTITPLAESLLLCAGLIAEHGSAAQIARWVEPVARGAMVLGFVHGAQPTRKAEGWLVDGSPDLVRDGMAAAAFLVVAPDAPPLLVAADAPGVTRRPVRLVDGSVAAQVRFDGAAAEAVDAAPDAVATAIGRAELAIVAEMVGAMATLLDTTVDHVKQRRQFGVPIGSFQAVQHRCARLFILLEQSRSMLFKAALPEEGRGRALQAAKAYVADAALRLAEDAVQLHGGMGVTDEALVGRGLRRVLLLSRLFGGAPAARARIMPAGAEAQSATANRCASNKA